MTILDHKHRDQLLTVLYQNKEMYVFVCGKDWFDEKILNIWTEWLKYEMPCPNVLHTPEFQKMFWEIDHNYCEK